MTTSKKQIAANRYNAQKSTGPTTDEGKSIASRNAITHGLHASDIIIKSPHLTEDESQYQQLLTSLIDELQPQGVFQEHLVIKIANCMWRYRRAINAETANINDQLVTATRIFSISQSLKPDSTAPFDPDQSPELLNKLHDNSIPRGSTSTSLLFYEMRLDRQLSRAYQLLRHLQYIEATKKQANHNNRTQKQQNEPISSQLNDFQLDTWN